MQFLDDDDLPYEEDCMRNPYHIKAWQRYIDCKSKTKNPLATYIIYERALKLLPGSYKLWYNYLKYRRSQLKHKPINDNDYEDTNNAYERALAFMHKVTKSIQIILN